MRSRYIVFLSILLICFCLFCNVKAGRDFYKILGLERSSTSSQIKASFRKLAKKYHPDSNLDNPDEAQVKFEEISHAYDVLFDEEKRAIYDQYGEEGLEKGNQRGGFNPFNPAARNENKMPPINLILEVSLEDVYEGKEMEIEVHNRKICPHCRGSGADTQDDFHKCSQCKGAGMIIQNIQVGPGMYQRMQRGCPVCQGRGKTISKKCHVCKGNKVVNGHSHETLYVEKGMQTGDVVYVPKAGDELPGKVAGDLRYKIYVAPHDRFIRNGESLTTHLTITLKEALLGFSKTIKHLDGTEFEVKRSGVTQPGQVITLQDLGMPKKDYNVDHGSLFIVINVVNPQLLSESAKQQLANIL